MQYEVTTTEMFDSWFDGLRDQRAADAISRNILKLAGGLFGNVASIGDGVSELKVDIGAEYRVYFVTRGATIIVLLSGGDKSSQKRDIKHAKKIAADLE